MQKRKFKFNIMDALILLALVAAAAVLLYVFVLSEKVSGDALGGSDVKTVTYVIEVSGLDEDYADKIKVGQTLIDSSKKMNIGTVTAVETQPYTYTAENRVEGALQLRQMDGQITQYVTVEATASLNGFTYATNGYDLFVGKLVYMSLPDIVCSGYCIALDVQD